MSTKRKTPKKSAKKSAKKNGKLGPVAMVWQIASKLGAKAARKEVLEACVNAGVNPFTAATQYHKWKHASTAQRNGKVAEAKEQKEEPVAAK